MTEVELYGGPFDGRRLRVPGTDPQLRVPVATAPESYPHREDAVTRIPLLVATYVRCDHLNGSISYRYQGQETLR